MTRAFNSNRPNTKAHRRSGEPVQAARADGRYSVGEDVRIIYWIGGEGRDVDYIARRTNRTTEAILGRAKMYADGHKLQRKSLRSPILGVDSALIGLYAEQINDFIAARGKPADYDH